MNAARDESESQMSQWHGSAFYKQSWVGPNTMTILRDGTFTIAPDFDQGADFVEKDGHATIYRDRHRRIVSREKVLQALVDAKVKQLKRAKRAKRLP